MAEPLGLLDYAITDRQREILEALHEANGNKQLAADKAGT